MSKKFAEYSQFDLSKVNKDVLKKWDENQVFAKSMTEREGCPSFVFFEGPPSANGMPENRVGWCILYTVILFYTIVLATTTRFRCNDYHM